MPPLLKRFKTDANRSPEPVAPVGPEGVRVLVVDDHPDAGHLLGKLFRREGYEVAETHDHQVAISSLVNQEEPVGAIVASFTTKGTVTELPTCLYSWAFERSSGILNQLSS